MSQEKPHILTAIPKMPNLRPYSQSNASVKLANFEVETEAETRIISRYDEWRNSVSDRNLLILLRLADFFSLSCG